MQKTQINRPWLTSFPWADARFSETSLEQIHKLCRNFVASLNMGCSNVSHVEIIAYGKTTEGMDEKQLYLEWVRSWKIIYRELSELIYTHKQHRKTIHFPKYSFVNQERWLRLTGGTNQSMPSHLNALSTKQLGRLKETAQVLLNARYNAKLASAERRRRAGLVSITGNATVSKTGDVGSTPTLAAELA